MDRIKLEVYTNKFTAKALANGYSTDNINKCLNYATPLIQKGLPVIYNVTHFSQQVGYKSSYLKRAVKFPTYFYRNFEINKANGQTRKLSEPLPSLKEIQDWILKEVLYKNKVSRYAKGYVPGRSIKEHAMYHTDENMVLTMDIEKFFDSISFDLTENLFLEMGYSDRISNLIAKLCYLNNRLPQGAATSPYISNLILRNFDDRIGGYCMENKIKYTRYADDLAFSGDLKRDEIETLVQSELVKIDLKLNADKTKLMRRNDPQLICGIIVNKKSQVPKRARNEIRNEMYYIKKFGLVSHLKKTNEARGYYMKHLLGRINYVLMINPRDKEFLGYKKDLYDLK